MLHEEFAPASRPRTESLFPFAPVTGHSQLVSFSLPSRISVYPAFFRPRSRSYPALSPPRSGSPSTFSFGDINPSLLASSAPPFPLTLTLLFPPPYSHENFFLFYAALYRCSCLLTHSLLQFFRRPLRPSRRVSSSLLFFLLFARAANDCAPIHPPDFSLSHLSNSTTLRSPRLSVFHPLPRSHPPSPPHI